MKKNKVSVIVPVYNSEKYIEKCIYSILNQKYDNIEIIIVNDGSTDNSDKICKKIASENANIKYYYKKNEGASTARNYGISKATGDFIMFVDSDDTIDNLMIDTMIKKINKENVDLVVSGMRLIDTNTNKVVELSNEELTITGKNMLASAVVKLFINERINGPVAKLYKKEIINKNNIQMPSGIHLNEDLNFNVDYLKNINSISIIPQIFYNYYHNSNSVTGRYYPNRYEMLNIVNDNIIDYFENSQIDIKNIGQIYYLYVKLVYSSFLNLFHKDCPLSKKEKINKIKEIINSDIYMKKISKAKKEGLKYNILLYILKTKNEYIIYYMSKIFAFLRSNKILKY